MFMLVESTITKESGFSTCLERHVHRMMSFGTVSQGCIDWNRDVLKRELGLEEEDIIDLPILFKLVGNQESQDTYRALAYYPDMVGRRI